MHFLILVLTLATLAAGCSARQSSRSLTDLQQRIRPGHTLYVIDATGTETRGKLTAFTPSGLTLIDVSGISRTFNEPQIRQVQRYGDSLWNGALIGVAIVAPYYLVGGLLSSGDPQCAGECITAANSVLPRSSTDENACCYPPWLRSQRFLETSHHSGVNEADRSVRRCAGNVVDLGV